MEYEKEVADEDSLPVFENRSCSNCLHQCLEPDDMNFTCQAVNKPWGRYLHQGKPVECGPENKLWQIDTRQKVI